jgi:hypothetical protein
VHTTHSAICVPFSWGWLAGAAYNRIENRRWSLPSAACIKIVVFSEAKY